MLFRSILPLVPCLVLCWGRPPAPPASLSTPGTSLSESKPYSSEGLDRLGWPEAELRARHKGHIGNVMMAHLWFEDDDGVSGLRHNYRASERRGSLTPRRRLPI